MAPTRPLNAAVKAEVAADLNGLPHARIAEHDGAAHVFTTGLDDLTAWFMFLGGHITRRTAGPGVVLWTLTTRIGDVYATPVHIHAPALDADQIDDALTAAIRPHAA